MNNELDDPASLDTLIAELRESMKFTNSGLCPEECNRALDALELARAQRDELYICTADKDEHSINADAQLAAALRGNKE